MKGKEKNDELQNRFQPQPFVLGPLQATIRRYSWQAAVVRLAALAVVAWFFTSLPGVRMIKTPVIYLVWPVLCLFLLWLWEGHLKSMQGRYCDLYEQASKGNPVDLTFPVPRQFNVSGLWIPRVVLHYALLIGLCAVVILGIDYR